MADINKFLPNPIGNAGKKHSFEAPVREEQQIFIFRSSIGQDILEAVAGDEIGFDPAVLTGEQSVCFI
ncbi:MAG: hypothetical protein PVI06_18815 [Desulfobacterales bacterium]